MAKRSSEGDLKAISSNLASLKFMKMGKSKEAVKKVKQVQQPEEEEKWVAQESQPAAQGCIVIQEDDPPPENTLGRMSFLGFNPEVEALQRLHAEREELLKENGQGTQTPTAQKRSRKKHAN